MIIKEAPLIVSRGCVNPIAPGGCLRTIQPIKFQKQMGQGARKCQRYAVVTVDGIRMCKQHAGEMALYYLMSMSE